MPWLPHSVPLASEEPSPSCWAFAYGTPKVRLPDSLGPPGSEERVRCGQTSLRGEGALAPPQPLLPSDRPVPGPGKRPGRPPAQPLGGRRSGGPPPGRRHGAVVSSELLSVCTRGGDGGPGTPGASLPLPSQGFVHLPVQQTCTESGPLETLRPLDYHIIRPW